MSTYPDEQYPSDATITALNGAADEATGLDYVARGANANSTPSYEVQYNRRLHRQNRILASLRQGMVVDEGSLKIGVYPISYTLSATRKTFEGATGQSVADDSTKKVYLDSSNVLQIQNSFPGDVTAYLPLATVVTASGTMTVTDERPAVMFIVPDVTGQSYALAGANSDITSLGGLTMALSVAQGGTGQTAANVVPYTPTFVLSGAMSVKVWEIQFVAPVAFVFKNATGRVNTAPTGSALICDIRVDGTSIFADQSEMISIAATEYQDASATKDHSVSAGEVITVEIEQVGSSTAGSDLTVVLNGRTALQT